MKWNTGTNTGINIGKYICEMTEWDMCEMIKWNKYEIWKKKSLNLKRNLLKELVQFFDFFRIKITQKRQKNKTNSLNKFRLRLSWSGRIVLLNGVGEERRGEQCIMWSEQEIKCRRQSIISAVWVGSKDQNFYQEYSTAKYFII